MAEALKRAVRLTVRPLLSSFSANRHVVPGHDFGFALLLHFGPRPTYPAYRPAIMLVLRQFAALLHKNWIILTRHWAVSNV
jgi:hypothetical protein